MSVAALHQALSSLLQHKPYWQMHTLAMPARMLLQQCQGWAGCACQNCSSLQACSLWLLVGIANILSAHAVLALLLLQGPKAGQPGCRWVRQAAPAHQLLLVSNHVGPT
jgi:hypothetical protein